MTRTDLLALTADDLAAITNRGTVKRAEKELAAREVTCELSAESDALVFRWSDGTVCCFPDDKTIHEATCSSGSPGISRHVIRSVLEYQRVISRKNLADHPAPESSDAVNSASASMTEKSGDLATWDPGSFKDEDLVAQFRKAAVAKASKRFDQGVLVELTRGSKPVARFLDEGWTVRFLVPNDLRYVQADCADELLATWVPMAVWAFRHLPASQLAGLVSIQRDAPAVPADCLQESDRLLGELLSEGLHQVTSSWATRLARLEKSMRKVDLVWPAELAAELLHQYELYGSHDARFDPGRVILVVGEWIARCRAIRRNIDSVPQPLIRGSKSDRATDITGGRFVGVGLGVQVGKRCVTLSGYLQDADSGSVVAVERTFTDPDPQAGVTPRKFSDLAESVIARGISLANLASSQLLVRSGKRTPSGVLVLPRTAGRLAANPQTFQWEQLKPPFAMESFAQLAARLETLPPSYLRPRRRTENLHVVSIVKIEEVTFDAAEQRLIATIRDARDEVAQMVHPYYERGAEAFGHFLECLQRDGERARFICGHVRGSGTSLRLSPVSVVLDFDDHRVGVQPWLSHQMSNSEAAVAASLSESNATRMEAHPALIDRFFQQWEQALTDLMLTGVAAGNSAVWEELSVNARQVGFARLADAIETLAQRIDARSRTVRWESTAATEQAVELCLLWRLAMD